MSKTILLELTEKEAELVQKGVLNRQTTWDLDGKDGDFNDHENHLKRCDTILSKLEKASLPQEDHLITFKDLFYIVSLAKGQYHSLPSNPHLSGKEVKEGDLKHISLANAVIMWLNSNRLLKKLAVFDFTDSGYEFEQTEE